MYKLIQQCKSSFTFEAIWKSKVYFVLFVPIGLLTYLGYIQYKFGNFTLLFTSMKSWGQDKMVLPLQVVWRYIKILAFHPTFKLNYWIALLELSSVLLYSIILLYSYKKIRFSYWLFMCISFLIPALTGTFQGMPRYALHLYPFFLSLYIFIQSKSYYKKALYILCNLILLLLLVALFTNGHFVA